MAVNHVCLGREMYRAAANLADKRADLFPAQVSPTENTRAVRTMSTRPIDTSCGVAEFRRVDRSHIAKNPVYPRIPERLATFQTLHKCCITDLTSTWHRGPFLPLLRQTEQRHRIQLTVHEGMMEQVDPAIGQLLCGCSSSHADKTII
jgi:hypothetical protein